MQQHNRSVQHNPHATHTVHTHSATQMLRSGKYAVGTDWILGARGQPMDHQRAQTAFELMVWPESADLTSVRAVFFS